MAFVVDNKKMARNTVILYLRTGITMIISFFTARVTLEILGSEDYGLNNLVGSIVSLFSFINASMGTAVQRFFNYAMGKGDAKELGKVYGVGVYLHIIVALITFILCEFFAFFLLEKMNIPVERMFAAKVVFQISVISMVLQIINVPNFALLKSYEEFSRIAFIEIIQACLRLGVLYLLYTIKSDKLIIYSLLNFGITLYYVLAFFISARKYQESHHPISRDSVLVKQMLKFISLLTITVFAELGRNQGLVMIVNVFFGLAINAAFAIAMQIANMVNTFIVNIKQPMVPQLMASYGAGDIRSMQSIIFLGTKVTCIMLLLISVPVIFEMDTLLKLWLISPPKYSSEIAILFLINANISSFTYFLYQGVHATGQITRQQVIISSLYVCNILLIYISFKAGIGFHSSLYITIVVSIIQCFFNTLLAKKHYNLDVHYFLHKCLFPCCALILIVIPIMYGIVNLFIPSLWRLIMVFIIGATLILVLGYFIVLDKLEKEKILLIIKSHTQLQNNK